MSLTVTLEDAGIYDGAVTLYRDQPKVLSNSEWNALPTAVKQMCKVETADLPSYVTDTEVAGFVAPDGTTFAMGANGGFAVGQGAESGVITASGRGTLAKGYARGAGAKVLSSGDSSFAMGDATDAGSEIKASGDGAFACGYAYEGAKIHATAGGAMAGAAAGGADALIQAAGFGSIAWGRANNGGNIKTSGTCFALGRANYGTISAGYGGWSGNLAGGYSHWAGSIKAEGKYGQIAWGYATGFGATLSEIKAEGHGAVAMGYTYAPEDGTVFIRATGKGSFAHGHSKFAGGNILASGIGARATGFSVGTGIVASGIGAFAHGYAYGAAITANNKGSVALGYSYSGALTASNKGAIAVGYARTNAITASGIGSGAFGSSDVGTIVASAKNAFQFGPGTNALALSLQVGSGILILGTVGTPGAPADGMIWKGSDNKVYVRSNGVSVAIGG